MLAFHWNILQFNILRIFFINISDYFQKWKVNTKSWKHKYLAEGHIFKNYHSYLRPF